MRKKRHSRVKHFLWPHKGNKFKPGLFAKESIAVIALVLLLIEGAYIFQIKVFSGSSGFTAAVLPAALTDLANEDRASQGLSQLVDDPLLAMAAQAKADDMAKKSYFSHTSPDGRTLRDFLSAVNYDYSYAGENLAVDFTDSADVEKAWMNSPTHRANLLKREYRYVGFGVAQGMYEGREVTFVAQFFAAHPEASPAVAQARPKAAVATQQVEARVLGEEVIAKDAPASAAPSVPIAVVATSPSHLMQYLLLAFTALVAVIFSIAVATHIRNKYLYLEVLAGGAILLVFGIGLMLFNSSQQLVVKVPHSDQAASVAASIYYASH